MEKIKEGQGRERLRKRMKLKGKVKRGNEVKGKDQGNK